MGKVFTYLILLPLTFLAPCHPFATGAQSQEPVDGWHNFSGAWVGTMQAGAFSGAIEMYFGRDRGRWEAKGLFRIDGQGESNLVRDLRIEEGEISFTTELSGLEVRFSGRLLGDDFRGVLEAFKDGSEAGDGTWRMRPNSAGFLGKRTSGNSGNRGAGPVYQGSEVTKGAVLLSKPEPGYTEEARRNKVSGVVRLKLVLTSSGEVSNISIIMGLPDGLTELAVAAARRIKFIPARKDGRAVSQRVTVEYFFSPRRGRRPRM